MIIDVHTHIGNSPAGNTQGDFKHNLDLLVSEMKENMIDKLLLISYFRDDAFGISTKNLLLLLAGLDNVYAIGSINVNEYSNDDLNQLENWLKTKVILGVKLYPAYLPFYPHDKSCAPIYELCEKYSAPVIFHSGDTLAGIVKSPKVKYAHPLHIDDVAADRPNLKIVIAHMGNPWLTDCAEVVYKNPNVYADISGLVVEDNFDNNYGTLLRRRIKDLLSYSGKSDHKLMYGTDWPLCRMSTYISFAKSLEMTDDELDRLFFKNAVSIFNL